MPRFPASIVAVVAAASVGGFGEALQSDYLGQRPPGTTAEIFAPAIVSTERAESAPLFSADGREFYFSRAFEGGRREIMVSRRESGGWSAPAPVSFTDRRFDDSKPALSADGRMLVFASNRPLPSTPDSAPNFLSLWFVKRHEGGWTAPQPLGPEVNTSSDEDFPVLTSEGTLWFASNRSAPPTGYRIYRSQRKPDGSFDAARLHASPIDSGYGEAICYVAPDNRYIIFMSMRPGGVGSLDLYASFQAKDGSWGPSVNLGPSVNSPRMEQFASVTPDGRYLLFSSDRTGNLDVYWISATVIDTFRPR